MTADIVNLRQARKRRLRAEKEAVAAQNRSKFGLPQATRRHDDAMKAIEKRKLDGLRRIAPASEPDV